MSQPFDNRDYDVQKLAGKDAEIERLEKWVNDLQSGMYVNCVYCGHRYGPESNTPVSMAQVLTQHIEKCPHHPLNAARAENERLKAEFDRVMFVSNARAERLAKYEKLIAELADALSAIHLRGRVIQPNYQDCIVCKLIQRAREVK